MKKYAFEIDSDMGYWWLRSPGDAKNSASFVIYYGSIYDNGHVVSDAEIGVRPVIRVSL